MQQKFRMFLYIIRPIGIRVKICDYVNQNTAHSRGIDLSERTVLEMSVITMAGLLALASRQAEKRLVVVRELAALTAHYYDRSYHRHERYTL